jgi:formylglycine-generating enzyme required for sulfatase activity
MRKHSEKTYFCDYKVNHRKGVNRVNRGGSWNNDAENCRVANRNNWNPTNRNNNVGFRLVRSS